MAKLTAGPASTTRSSCLGSFRHPLQARNPADRQQGDVSGAGAKPPCRERVPILVQQDA